MIDSNQLNVLMAVESSSTLSEAAEILGITQSAVSQNLKSIESKAGFKVVTKVGKKITLTPNGEKLAKLGKSYFKRLDFTLTEIENNSNKIIGSVSIGTMFGLGKSWVINRVVEFSELFPDLSLQVKMDSSEVLLKKFESSELDCVILPASLTPAHSTHKILHDEEIVFVYSKKAPFSIDKNISVKDFAELPLIFFEQRDTLFYNWCRIHFGQIPRGLKPRLVMNSFGNMLNAVHMGLGVAVVPYHVYKRSHFVDQLETLGSKITLPSSSVNFIYHIEDQDNLKLKTLYDFLKKEVERLEANEESSK